MNNLLIYNGISSLCHVLFNLIKMNNLTEEFKKSKTLTTKSLNILTPKKENFV